MRGLEQMPRGRYPEEIGERAVRMVIEYRKEYPSEWAAIGSIASKLGMAPATAPPGIAECPNLLCAASGRSAAGATKPKAP